MNLAHLKYKKPIGYFKANKLSLLIISLLLIIGASSYYQLFKEKKPPLWFEAKAASNSLISLPEDDAPHLLKMEWWYYNGHLLTASGKKYSFHDSLFLVNSGMSQMVNHVSLTDHQSGKHYIDQRSTAGNLSVGTVNRFDFTTNSWSVAGGNGIDKLIASTPQFSFKLNLTNTMPPVFHGQDGVISLGSAGNSFYYSRTRMTITGTLQINGQTEEVTGIAWFDHQWGDFSTTQLSWDWFSLQLDDQSDVMIYQLRDKANQTILYTGSYTKDGITEILSNKDFTLTKGQQWHSTKTDINYPIAWKIIIPSKNLDLTTHSIINDSEFDASLTSYNVYWEGAIKVSGSHTGLGFMELSGYSNTKN
jgi:predicted secreted hydrolase